MQSQPANIMMTRTPTSGSTAPAAPADVEAGSTPVVIAASPAPARNFLWDTYDRGTRAQSAVQRSTGGYIWPGYLVVRTVVDDLVPQVVGHAPIAWQRLAVNAGARLAGQLLPGVVRMGLSAGLGLCSVSPTVVEGIGLGVNVALTAYAVADMPFTMLFCWALMALRQLADVPLRAQGGLQGALVGLGTPAASDTTALARRGRATAGWLSRQDGLVDALALIIGNELGLYTDRRLNTYARMPRGGGAAPVPPAAPAEALFVADNQVRTQSGGVWSKAGFNLNDDMACGIGCTRSFTALTERLDRGFDMGFDWVRYLLEGENGTSYSQQPARWDMVVNVTNYVRDVHPGKHIEVALWRDPSFNAVGWPTTNTTPIWTQAAKLFGNQSHVFFGLANEPKSNYDGALSANVTAAFNTQVAAIRATGANNLVLVGGHSGWARYVKDYLKFPITAGNGQNVAFAVHPYGTLDQAQTWLAPCVAGQLPCVIEEFGPVAGTMTAQDVTDVSGYLRSHALAQGLWALDEECAPGMILKDVTTRNECYDGSSLTLSDWGNQAEAIAKQVNG